MNNTRDERQFEETHLKKTIEAANLQLEEARQKIEKTRQEIIEAKKEIRENSSHSITNLYSSDSFEALIELSQSLNPVNDKMADEKALNQQIDKLEKIIQNPYFARIDFCFSDQDHPDSFYIGQSSLKNEDTYKMLIFDWRSPIASVFYRFAPGPASYEAPIGTISGQLTLKRQYEIENGNLKYFFDSDVQVLDDFLRQMLSDNTASKMKTIIKTIQKEQDEVIRDLDSNVLIIQGVAGSGKTSIALHRAAYLMYQGLTHKLHARNILIISPNKVFEHYISTVIPDLDEENVITAVFDEVLSLLLNYKTIQAKFSFLEKLLSDGQNRHLLKTSLEFKSSQTFITILNRLIDTLPEKWMNINDIKFKGKCIVSKEEIKRRLLNNPGTPLKQRLKYLEEYIDEVIFETRKFHPDEQLMHKMMKFSKFNLLSVYKNLFNDKKTFYQLAKGLKLPKDIEAIRKLTIQHLNNRPMAYDDASALAYLNLSVSGSHDYQEIKQVIIDEAQDYYPIHYEIINLLFPKAKLTILGDISQTLEKCENLSFYEKISTILNRDKTSLVTMNKSYRCTTEILDFAARFLNSCIEIQSFNRSGDAPEIKQTPNTKALKSLLLEEIETCLKQGYESIGLICKSERNARNLYEALNTTLTLHLIEDESDVDLKGIFIMPVYLSKGLEFDTVLVCDANEQNYSLEEDKNLLYIACTRALHRLTLFAVGKLSPLI